MRLAGRLRLAALGLVLVPHLASAQGHDIPEELARRLVAAALEQTRSDVVYDGSYRRIGYPGGDVPSSIGVCTDVVIRAYRRVGVDLQVEVHEDMKRAFGAYPRTWGLRGPDSNIDHRRVPNLQTFLRRAGAQLATSQEASSAYRSGDLVTWMLPGNLPHIGIVASDRAPDGTPLIVHNIGQGPKLENILFTLPITGHFRYASTRVGGGVRAR